MEPGRDLDALVAEKVVGLDLSPREGGHVWGEKHHHDLHYLRLCQNEGCNEQWMECCDPDNPPSGPCVPWMSRYSTDIEAAWQVVEKLMFQYHDINLRYEPDFDVWICKTTTSKAQGDTAPEAICLAALEAVGAQAEERDP